MTTKHIKRKPTYEPYDIGPTPHIAKEHIEHRWKLLESFLRLQGCPLETTKDMLAIFDQAAMVEGLVEDIETIIAEAEIEWKLHDGQHNVTCSQIIADINARFYRKLSKALKQTENG